MPTDAQADPPAKVAQQAQQTQQKTTSTAQETPTTTQQRRRSSVDRYKEFMNFKKADAEPHPTTDHAKDARTSKPGFWSNYIRH